MKQLNNQLRIAIATLAIVWLATSCTIPRISSRNENSHVPGAFNGDQDSINSAHIKFGAFLRDTLLVNLIDSAIKNNQELNIAIQETNITMSESKARRGEYLPFANFLAKSGVEKSGRNTRFGALEANTDVAPGVPFPDPVPDLFIGAQVSWETDIFRKLRNARKSAVHRYLASIEGRNLVVTALVAEVANSYYELLALDNQLEILRKNIDLQQNALKIVRMQKEAAKVTELAVKKFEAEVQKNQSRQFDILQQILETENKINFLAGRFPSPVPRRASQLLSNRTDTVYSGLPGNLLQNRPDIRKAEQELMAAKLDVKTARARFYPSLTLDAGIGLNAVNAVYLTALPQSLFYSLGGQLMAPLMNRQAIKASYASATARQLQAVYNYERAILNSFIEVSNLVSMQRNLSEKFRYLSQQVEALTKSIQISTELFSSARADYMEVLMTQRDALESTFELVETKKEQMKSRVNLYRALGGGWK
jgi:outer membrane protein, multidrug efflux system